MCTWFYVDYKPLSTIIDKAQKLSLTSAIMNTMSKPSTMSGNIRPTDMAAVLAPNKQGNMAVFPMIWGFTHESMLHIPLRMQYRKMPDRASLRGVRCGYQRASGQASYSQWNRSRR